MTRLFSRIQSRWEEFQPTKTQAVWACALAIGATLVTGFGFAGWVSGARAEQMAKDAADNARVKLAVAVCVDDFLHASNVKERLAKLRSADFYTRGDIVATGGYATMPGEKEADQVVASRCAAALEQLPAPGTKS